VPLSTSFLVIAALTVISGIWVFMSSKLPAGLLSVVLITKLLSFGISATSALFLYLICERALKPAMKAHHEENGHEAHSAHGAHGVTHGAHGVTHGAHGPVGHMAQPGF